MSYARGYWCKNCEFFEEHVMFDGDEDNCEACGCPEAHHVHAKVVDSGD